MNMKALWYYESQYDTQEGYEVSNGQMCTQRGYNGQSDDSLPGGMDQDGESFITQFGLAQKLKLMNCLFLEFSNI
jgi:hypothetical protein